MIIRTSDKRRTLSTLSLFPDLIHLGDRLYQFDYTYFEKCEINQLNDRINKQKDSYGIDNSRKIFNLLKFNIPTHTFKLSNDDIDDITTYIDSLKILEKTLDISTYHTIDHMIYIGIVIKIYITIASNMIEDDSDEILSTHIYRLCLIKHFLPQFSKKEDYVDFVDYYVSDDKDTDPHFNEYISYWDIKEKLDDICTNKENIKSIVRKLEIDSIL